MGREKRSRSRGGGRRGHRSRSRDSTEHHRRGRRSDVPAPTAASKFASVDVATILGLASSCPVQPPPPPDTASHDDWATGHPHQSQSQPQPMANEASQPWAVDHRVDANFHAAHGGVNGAIPAAVNALPPTQGLTGDAAPSQPAQPPVTATASAAPSPPPQSTPPSDVDSFVPSIPKSLLQLVVSSGGGGGGALTLTGGASSFMTPEFTKITRESRRCHVTGFTHAASRQDLTSYFSMLVQDVRRQMIERETGRTVPDNALVDVDQVVDMSLDSTKAKPFAFVELSNADLVSELINQCAEDKERFLFHCAKDGGTLPLLLRRPKDYVAPKQLDPFKVVLQGISAIITDERLKQVMESFGALSAFQRTDRFVYCEFEDCNEAKECVEDLNGQVLQGRMVLAQLVTEPLRGVLLQSGLKLSDVKVDPNRAGQGADAGALTIGGGSGDGASEKKHDHVREALEFTTTLSRAVLNLKESFPFLEPQFGSNIPVFPTRILVLLNLFDESDVALDEEYSKLLAEISEEVERYGRVKQLIVPRRVAPPAPPKALPPKKFEPKQRNVSVLPLQNPFEGGSATTTTAAPAASPASEEDEYQLFLKEKEDEERRFQLDKDHYHKAREAWQQAIQHPVHGGVGRVFVEYETVDEAAEAQAAVSGKLFRHRTVVTSFLFEDVLYPPVEEDAEAQAQQADEAVEAYLRATVGVEAADPAAAQPDAAAGPSDTADID